MRTLTVCGLPIVYAAMGRSMSSGCPDQGTAYVSAACSRSLCFMTTTLTECFGTSGQVTADRDAQD